MSFNERLARASDLARALPEGEPLAIEIMRLANDIDSYLAAQSRHMRTKTAEAFTQWNAFSNAMIEDAHAYGEKQIAIERRRIARALAADPRWSGGYAGALAITEAESRP